MKKENLNSTAFLKLAAVLGTQTYQIVRAGDSWFEQLNDSQTIFYHKLLTIKNLTLDSLHKKNQTSPNQLGRVIDPSQHTTCAFIFESHSILYYCLVPIFKTDRAHALQLVEAYSKHLAPKKSKIQACAASLKAA